MAPNKPSGKTPEKPKTEDATEKTRTIRPVEERFRERGNTAIGRAKLAIEGIKEVGSVNGEVPDDMWNRYVAHLKELATLAADPPRPQAAGNKERKHRTAADYL